jgi:hypothetical protein
MMENKRLYIYTVTDHPTDHPDHYAVRRYAIEAGSVPLADPNFLILSKNLEEIRRTLLVDMSLVCLGRRPEDDRVIVESWI